MTNQHLVWEQINADFYYFKRRKSMQNQNKISFNLDFIIGGNLSEIEQKFKGIKDGLSGLLNSKDAPKGLVRQVD
jgi:hypothetical protein